MRVSKGDGMKQRWLNVNRKKDIQEFFVLGLQFFCRVEMISQGKGF